VHSQLGRRQDDDEPAAAGVDGAQVQHAGEEGTHLHRVWDKTTAGMPVIML